MGVERYRARVQATFAPRGWGGLIVRAAWSPSCGGAGVDLEVQASASSVGLLFGLDVEVIVQSRWRRRDRGEPPPTLGRRVLPRDARSAALSYDGRESAADLRTLVTLALTDLPRLQVFALPGAEDGPSYMEMVPPNDVARLIRVGPSDPELSPIETLAAQYALFGHDFEKGVVFRARLRGYWASSETCLQDANSIYQQFLKEPPPLGP